MHSICNQWEFTPEWAEGFANREGEAVSVRLPHTVKELPLHYIDHNAYQMLCGYRRRLELGSEYRGKRVFVNFDGAAHIATVYLNGEELMTHRTGYTGFRVELTEKLRLDGTDLLAVKLDTTENPCTPPFGGVVDYLTYGGLYREVWLDIREQSCIQDLYVTTPTLTRMQVQITADCDDGCVFRAELVDAEGEIRCAVTGGRELTLEYPQARSWSLEDPYRYTCRVYLEKDGTVLDMQTVKTGFRTFGFTKNGFFLNGKKTFLRGLNRHQCYPYVGYAAPERLQREDARILKEELGCVIVRTSHYPQSHYFIDECDRIGLLVFTEFPGWQHIGDQAWQDQAVENAREMVLQYRNHPSIVFWGVRINESPDCDDFYRRTNAVARELDPGRPTTGVRNFPRSHLLEDVYAFNDFTHSGEAKAIQPKRAVTPDMGKPLLITEHNGHMFPTKPFDPWQRRQEHALRHARVQEAAAADGKHIGCIGWCMFDYPTHKDFGSGDRVCYHGVLDQFRNPKLAAALYASQGLEKPVLALGSTMDIGDYPASNIGQVYAFTNADEVRLYKNGKYVSRLSRGEWFGLPHGPMLLTDTIGKLLETEEGFPKKKAALIKSALLSAARHGLTGMPLKDMLRLVYAMVRYRMKYDEGVALYGKYVGNWGGEATVWRFDGLRDGKVVSSVTCCPNTKLRLEVSACTEALREGDTYDMAAVRIRIVDGNGMTASFAQLPVQLELTGCAELVGPDVVTAEGGMTGTYIRTVGETGPARLTVRCEGLESVSLDFHVV